MERGGFSLTEIQEVPTSNLIMLTGPPGAGKSTFCHQVVLNGLATFKKLAEFWTIDVISELSGAPDEVKARFAELFDLYATILPDSSRDGYHCNLTANIPLEMEGDKPSGYDMVFSSSGGTEHYGHLSVLISAEIREHKLARQTLFLK